MEDVAIAYGYNNIEETIPKSMTIANQVCALCDQSLTSSTLPERTPPLQI
jgi:phenylalanyl-tRNA synthetase beta subunit